MESTLDMLKNSIEAQGDKSDVALSSLEHLLIYVLLKMIARLDTLDKELTSLRILLDDRLPM